MIAAAGIPEGFHSGLPTHPSQHKSDGSPVPREARERRTAGHLLPSFGNRTHAH